MDDNNSSLLNFSEVSGRTQYCPLACQNTGKSERVQRRSPNLLKGLSSIFQAIQHGTEALQSTWKQTITVTRATDQEKEGVGFRKIISQFKLVNERN